MAERRKLAEMIGEGTREMEALIAVFGMLDKFVLTEVGPTAKWTVAVLALALFFSPWGSQSNERGSDDRAVHISHWLVHLRGHSWHRGPPRVSARATRRLQPRQPGWDTRCRSHTT